MIVLTLRATNAEEETLRFDADSVLVGSDDLCDVTIPDEGVDARQCVLVARDDQIEMFHIGVSGGVLVNGQHVTHAQLGPEDELWIGSSVLRASVEAAEDAAIQFSEIASTVRAEEPVPEATMAVAPTDDRFALLDDVRTLINSIGTNENIFEAILDVLFSAVPVKRGFIGILGDDGELQIRAHRDREKGGGGGKDKITVSRTLLAKVMDSGNAVLTSDAEADPNLSMARSIHALRIRAATCVPLKANGRVIGVAYGDNRERPGSLTKDHLSVLNALGSVAAVAVDKMRLLRESEAKQKYEQALRIARGIQRHFLPSESPDVPTLDIFGSSESCDETGGDYYDYFLHDDGRLSIIVADVTGHGVGSALLMATVRAALRALMLVEEDLGRLFFQLNNMLGRDLKDGRFVTALMGTFDMSAGMLRQVGAGHTPLIRYAAATGETELISGLGPPLGIVAAAEFRECESLSVESGDVLLFLTDGIIEAAHPDGELYGFERLCATLVRAASGSAEEVVGAINGAVIAWTGGQPLHDDATLVAVKVR